MKLSKGAELALSRLEEKGFEAYVVGGSVRDSLMGHTPSDYDVTTNALPENTKEVFSDLTTFAPGAAHGTVSVVVDKEVVEITTYRHDGEYSDHRHPIGVSFTKSLADDLSRRDFTVNAMAYNPEVGIVDIFGGREDIENKLIRCVGESNRRFEEDALRILRALRFASVLNFQIEEETSKAIFKKAELLSFVSKERIYTELKKLVTGVGASRVVNEYKSVFEILFPTLEINAAALENTFDEMTGLAVFFYNAPDAFATLKPSKKEKELLEAAVRLAHESLPKTELDIKRLIASSGIKATELSFKVRRAFDKDQRLLQMLGKVKQSCDCLTKSELAIGGGDIVSLGIKPSPKVGEIIDRLFDEVLNGKIKNNKEELINYIKNFEL